MTIFSQNRLRRGLAAVLVILAGVSPLVQAAITIDGVLDEPEWAEAQVFDAFLTTDPLTLAPAKYKTVVKLLVNEAGIHVGFVNYQPEGVRRVRRKFARDDFLQADRNVVNIDFDGTGLSAYDFTVSASNSHQDGVLSGENNYSRDWDGTWYSQTREDEAAWYSEILIPWTVAPMISNEQASKSMGVYFSRVVFDESLRFAFPAASMTRGTFISDLHPVEVQNVKSSTLDWFPYLSSVNDLHNSDSELRAGMDMIWRPNSNQQITVSINPDFGQVESDDIEVNFSAFETFFEEKRPFFTENQSLFDVRLPAGNRLIHTRRIGSASDAGDEGVSDILFARKYTHYGEALDYGVFGVIEDDTRHSEGRNYIATRVQGRTGTLTLGHLLTYVDRPTLDREAMVNAIDLDWRYSDQTRVTANLLHSRVDQKSNEFNEQIDEHSSDLGGFVRVQYAPNDDWTNVFAVMHFGEDFEMNDFGFLRRNNFQELYSRTEHRINDYPESSRVRSTFDEIEWGGSRSASGDRHPLWFELERIWTFRSTRELELRGGYESTGYDDRVTRGNGLFRTQPQMWSGAIYRSTRGNKFSYEAKAHFDNKGTDAWSRRIAIEPSYYLTETLTLSGDFAYRKYDEWLLWDGDSSQMSTYEADLYKLDFKLDWYPSSRQEVRLKFQWIGIEAVALTGHDLSDSGHIRPSDVPVSDFSLSDTALQVRYKFELAPLSDIFLVYSRGGVIADDVVSRGPRDLLSDGWDQLVGESIIAKVRYRF